MLEVKRIGQIICIASSGGAREAKKVSLGKLWEADPKYAKSLVKAMNLEGCDVRV